MDKRNYGILLFVGFVDGMNEVDWRWKPLRIMDKVRNGRKRMRGIQKVWYINLKKSAGITGKTD